VLLRCSEGDQLSGLVVDAFRDTLVVASSAAWVEKCVSHHLKQSVCLCFSHSWKENRSK